MQIRNAELDDVIYMVKLAEVMHRESRYAEFNFDPMKLYMYLSGLIESDTGIALVAVQDSEIVGGFIGAVWPHYFGHSLQASDYGLFVHPDYRGRMVGIRLLNEYKKIATAMGAEEIIISNSSGVDRDRVKKLHEKLGGEHVGYVHSIRTKNNKRD